MQSRRFSELIGLDARILLHDCSFKLLKILSDDWVTDWDRDEVSKVNLNALIVLEALAIRFLIFLQMDGFFDNFTGFRIVEYGDAVV